MGGVTGGSDHIGGREQFLTPDLTTSPASPYHGDEEAAPGGPCSNGVRNTSTRSSSTLVGQPKLRGWANYVLATAPCPYCSCSPSDGLHPGLCAQPCDLRIHSIS